MRRFFWPFLIVLLASALTLVLWSGQGSESSFREMACVFEERMPGCVDSNEHWRRGLSYFDSALAANGDTLQSFKSLLWEFWNIEFAGRGEAAISKDAVLPLRVLETRKSGCMGLAWLAMMVAEARHLPLSVILLPHHVFLRYEFASDSLQCVKTVNLEPNRRGYSYSDEEYRLKYKEGPWTGLEFKPLEKNQFFGLAAFDIGNLYIENDPHRSLLWYRLAEELFPQYPGISANQEYLKKNMPVNRW